MLKKLKRLFQPSDMTVGTPWKSIAIFAFPMLIGNIAQQMYSTVDSIVVGNYVGDNALAAVGSSMPILNILLVLFVGISSGTTVMVSQYFGAKNKEELSATIGTAITLTAIASLALMLIGPLFVDKILALLNTPASIAEWCGSYLKISLYGIAGMAYYNILSGILRGMGDSFSTLVYLLIATVVNIVLDIVFVSRFHMGVAGVALATVIAQGFSSLMCMIKLLRMRSTFDLSPRRFLISPKHAKTLIRLGIPSGLTQAIMSSAMMIVQSLTNSFGEAFIAANVIIMRVDGFAMLPNFSFGMATTTYAGQNVGAGKYDRVIQGARQGTILSLVCSTVITGAILIFGKGLMGIFTDTVSLVEMSRRLMGILAPGYIAMAITQSLSGIMRGAGDTMTPMWISLMTTIGVRVPLAYLISFLTRTPELQYGRCECIQISLLTSWLVGALLTFIFYRLGKWKKKAIKQ